MVCDRLSSFCQFIFFCLASPGYKSLLGFVRNQAQTLINQRRTFFPPSAQLSPTKKSGQSCEGVTCWGWPQWSYTCSLFSVVETVLYILLNKSSREEKTHFVLLEFSLSLRSRFDDPGKQHQPLNCHSLKSIKNQTFLINSTCSFDTLIVRIEARILSIESL